MIKTQNGFDFVLFRELLNTQHFFDQNPQIVRNFPYKKYIEFLNTIKRNMYLVNLSLAYFNLYEKTIKESSKLLDELIKIIKLSWSKNSSIYFIFRTTAKC